MIRYLKFLLFGFFCILLIFLLNKHTPWRDEFQAWLIATRTSEWSKFFETIRIDRHPPLLHLFQRGLHFLNEHFHLSLSAKAQLQSVSAFFSISTAALCFFAFPSLSWVGPAIPFTQLFLREYGVISRGYSMGIFFLLFSLFLNQKNRLKLSALSLALCSFTHLLFTWICVPLAVFQFRKNKLLTALLLVVFTLAFLIQLPRSDSPYPILEQGFQLKYGLVDFFRHFAQGLTQYEKAFSVKNWNFNPMMIAVSLSIFLVWSFWIRKKKSLFLFYSMIFPLLILQVIQAHGGMRLRGFVFISLLTLSVIEKKKSWLIPPVIIGCIASFQWILAWRPDLNPPRFDFSGSQELVEFLDHRPAIIAATEEHLFYSVVAQSPIKLWDIGRNEWMRYPIVTTTHDKGTLSLWCSSLPRVSMPLYLGLKENEPLPAPCLKHFKQTVFRTHRPTVTDERYQLFKFHD